MKATNRSDREPLSAALPPQSLNSSEDPRKQVVGVILSDGTIYGVEDPRTDAPLLPWSKGRFSGRGWTIWWERRTSTSP